MKLPAVAIAASSLGEFGGGYGGGGFAQGLFGRLYAIGERFSAPSNFEAVKLSRETKPKP